MYFLFSQIVQRLFNQVVELIHRIAQGLGLVHLNIRLHLAHDAAHVLPACHRAVIRTQRHNTGLPSGDSADIIACMLIADFPVINTPDHRAVGMAGDTSGIHAAEKSRIRTAGIDA